MLLEGENLHAGISIALYLYLSDNPCRLRFLSYILVDPHPGNLRRTPSGQLCIMDWGLVTPVEEYIQTTLITHVSHLVSKDYAKVPSDLVKLGFVPNGT